MRGQYEELSCPFCDKGKIQAWYIPGAWSVKSTGRTSLPGTRTKHKSSEIWLIKSSCNICGKSQKEVEKKLKELNII